jgi:hypothetical protein
VYEQNQRPNPIEPTTVHSQHRSIDCVTVCMYVHHNPPPREPHQQDRHNVVDHHLRIQSDHT